MSFPAKGGSQLSGWQIASSRDSFCDFGRKLGNLSLPVKTHTSLRETLNQADLDLSYFRTTEQNSPGLMRFANRNPPEPPYTGKLISPTNQHLQMSYP